LHLLDYSGSIVIDRIDIASISRQQLRSRVTVIGQDPVELPSSVRHNINPWSYSAEVNDIILRELLSKVALWDKVSASGGLDTELSAIGFSQGQLQLFCLARAILHQKLSKSKIVLVDEATSSVDDETDRHMQSLMREAFSGCTVITVAHRLDTIKDVDLTVVLEDGKRVI
jgi:ABC-type multidrug transport system fused ATPase/permease subunit